jgi:predicted Zn-dependent protease
MDKIKDILSRRSLYTFYLFSVMLISAAFFYSCEESNIFSDKDDVELGKEIDKEIKADPNFPMLVGHADIKDYVSGIGSYILNNSPRITKKNIYPYNFQVVNDTIVNAFCTPGGFVYVYTGLMKFIDNEATLAGVVAHEIAHAEKRHVTQRITAAYTVNAVLGLILGGNPSMLSQIAANLFVGLAFLKNSREDESEADYYSIQYLRTTKYYPGSITFFFDKIREEQKRKGETPGELDRLLATHPLPQDRITDANNWLKEISPKPDPTKGLFTDEYQQLKQKLP